MVRKQMYILPQQDVELKKLAKEKRVTEAEIIREALENFIMQEKLKQQRNPLWDIVGLSENENDPQNGATAHDRYLYASMQ